MSRNLNTIEDELLDLPNDKGDQIFQSSGQNSVPRDGGGPSFRVENKQTKKDTVLLTFLSKITAGMMDQMQEYLKKEGEFFKASNKPFCIYEDVLIVYTYKKKEEQIRREHKKNKADTIKKLSEDLENQIKKKSGTIQERIKKKLATVQI